MELPVFVVHGAVVWKILLVGLVAITFGIGALRRHRRARARADELAKQAIEQITPLAAGPVVLRGRIEKGTVRSIETDAEVIESTSTSGQVVLDHAGEKVELGGTIALLQGATMRGSIRNRSRTFTAGPGDEVVVMGTAEPCGDSEVQYRETGNRWRLVGEVAITAVQPRPRARSLGPIRTAAYVAVSGLVWFLILNRIGALAAERGRKQGVGLDELDSFDAISIAAAMPGSRERALEVIDWQFDRAPWGRQGLLELRLAFDELRGRCPARTLLQSHRIEEAPAAARRCNDGALASIALAFLGRWEEAWNEPGRDRRPLFTVTAAIATRRWREAATAADAYAVEQSQQEPASYLTPEDIADQDKRARCFAAMLRGWAGDADPFAKIEGHHAHPHCLVFAALLRPAEEQAALLRTSVLSSLADYDLRAIRDEIRAIVHDPEVRRDDYDDTLGDVVGYSFERTRWLAPFDVASLPPDLPPEDRGGAYGRLAGYLAMRGDLAGAREAVATSHAADPGSFLRYTDLLVLALLAPSAQLPEPPDGADKYIHPAIASMVHARRGEPLDLEQVSMVYDRACRSPVTSAVAAAQTGDGQELARVLGDCRFSNLAVRRIFLGLLPRIRTHRAEVAAAMRGHRNDLMSFTLRDLPLNMVRDAASYRWLAHAIGDEEMVTMWQGIVDRHAKALEDYRVAVAMLLWTH